jgi:hypothetical protein
MANKKISEITAQASGADLSEARYIAAVPDGDGFVTKYVQGFGAGSAGGFIDKLIIGTNNVVSTFPNFDTNTQVIFAQLFASSSTGSVWQELTVGEETLTMYQSKLSLTAEGGVRAYDTASGNTTFVFHLFRFTRANLGGGGGMGRAYGRLVNATGTYANDATMQEGAFNMTGTHTYQAGTRGSPGTNTFTFTFGSTITNPIPIVTVYEHNGNATQNVVCSTTECVVTLGSSDRSSGCSCLIL